jgi:hypothetical protein
MTPEAWEAMQPRNTGSGGFGFGGGRFLGPPGGRNGVAARQGVEFDYVHASLQIGDWTFADVAARFKGNGSYLRATRGGGDKISIKVDLNKYVKGQKLAGLTTINFQNNITDVGWMNEVLAYRLYRDAGALAPRTTYAQVRQRALKVAKRLEREGITLGDRVATLAWNSDRHLALWYGISGIGAITHTVNPRLFPEQIAGIIDHAGDRLVFLDLTVVPLVEKLQDKLPSVERYVVLTDAFHMPDTTLKGAVPYEDWLDSAYDAWVARPGVPRTPFASGRTATARGTSGRLVTAPAPDLRRLAAHVVNLGNEGLLSTTGKFVSTPMQIERMFDHMARWHDFWQQSAPGSSRRARIEAENQFQQRQGGDAGPAVAVAALL